MCVVGIDLGVSSYPFISIGRGNVQVPAPGEGPVTVPQVISFVSDREVALELWDPLVAQNDAGGERTGCGAGDPPLQDSNQSIDQST